VPLALVIDGAPELRDAAEVLQKQRPEMLVLNDFKHKAANIPARLVHSESCHHNQRLRKFCRM